MNTVLVTRPDGGLVDVTPRPVDLWRIRGQFVLRLHDGRWLNVSQSQLLKLAALRKLLLDRANFMLAWNQRKLDQFVNHHLHKHKHVIDALPSGDDLAPDVGSVVAYFDARRGKDEERSYVRDLPLAHWLAKVWGAKYGVEGGAVEAYLAPKNSYVRGHLYMLWLPIEGSVFDSPALMEAFEKAGFHVEREDGEVTTIFGNRCPPISGCHPNAVGI